MKRSLSGAEIDFVAQEAEEILRAQVIAEEDAELRLREIALKQASIDKALSDRIEKWDKEGLMSAAHGDIRPPVPNPTLGSLLPFPSLPVFSLTTGFNLNHRLLGRHPTALSVMRHFVPRGIWKDLATTTQSKISSLQNSKTSPSSSRHTNIHVTSDLLEQVFFTRLHMALHPLPNLTAAYKKVLLIAPNFFSLCQNPGWYPKKHHFSLINAGLWTNIAQLSRSLSDQVRRVWKVNSYVVTDESIFKWEGACEEGLRKYIPRKPNPNGFLSYGMCGWTYVNGRKQPVLLDSEPCDDPDHDPSAQMAFLALSERFSKVDPFSPVQFLVMIVSSQHSCCTCC
jgi:hypothetical protein